MANYASMAAVLKTVGGLLFLITRLATEVHGLEAQGKPTILVGILEDILNGTHCRTSAPNRYQTCKQDILIFNIPLSSKRRSLSNTTPRTTLFNHNPLVPILLISSTPTRPAFRPTHYGIPCNDTSLTHISTVMTR